MKVQLALKIPAMGFDGIKAQVERAGDVFVGLTLDQQLQDLSFARGKQIVAILGAPDIDLSDVILSEDLADFRAEERLAFAHGFDCLDEIALGRIFQQVASRAGFQRAEDIPLVGMHTQNDDCRLGKLSADPLRRLDAAQFRHCDIENHNLGPCSKSVFDRLISV